MATFKVGQRVRIVSPLSDFCGREGTIWHIEAAPIWHPKGLMLGLTGPAYSVDVDCAGRTDGIFFHGYPHDWLAPLTDPLADAFIERIKKLGREPAPMKETVKVGG